MDQGYKSHETHVEQCKVKTDDNDHDKSDSEYHSK